MTPTAKPAKEPAPPADVAIEETPIPEQLAELRSRLTAFEQGFTTLQEGLPAAIEAAVAEVVGPKLAEHVKGVLKPEVEGLLELVQAAVSKAEQGGEIVDAFAHAKIGALHNAVERSIGITIPMPVHSSGAAGNPEVRGAETADQLST